MLKKYSLTGINGLVNPYLEKYGLIAIILTALTLSLCLRLFYTWWNLRHIPGPILASLTNLRRVAWVKTTKAHLIHKQLHEKYGEVVRFGPNMVSISDPSTLSTIYPMRRGFPKGDLYIPQRPYSKTGGALPAVFTSLDEEMHMKLKYPIAPIFSLSSVVTFETIVDDVLAIAQEQLDKRFASSGEIFDLGKWMQFFAFDVMGTLTFSKRYGFLENGEDPLGMLDSIFGFMKQAAPMMQIPWLDKILYKNKLADSLRRTPGNFILKFIGDRIQERQNQASEDPKILEGIDGRKDFLSRYIETQMKDPNIPPWYVRAWTFSNVMAGSDSVGTVMQTLMFHILSTPSTLERLYAELESANLSRPFPTWAETKNLPYLDACVQEALRVHPPFNLPFERVVPHGGITIHGAYLPAGTIVGQSPYVINHHKPTFGQDAEFWRPERWLEGGPERRKKMDDSLLTFGFGRRVCLGRHIGIFELKKLIPFLVLNYHIHLIDPKARRSENHWFFKQWGLYASIKQRTEAIAI